MLTAIEMVLVCLVAQAALTDLTLRKIPNVLILSGLLLALILHSLAGPHGAVTHQWLAGAVTGFFLFLPLYLLRAMAAGDVKLLAMVGAFLGPLATVQVAALATLFGGVLALLMLLCSGQWRQAWRNLHTLCAPLWWRCLGLPMQAVPLPAAASVGGIPYGLAIALATASTVLLASP